MLAAAAVVGAEADDGLGDVGRCTGEEDGHEGSGPDPDAGNGAALGALGADADRQTVAEDEACAHAEAPGAGAFRVTDRVSVDGDIFRGFQPPF